MALTKEDTDTIKALFRQELLTVQCNIRSSFDERIIMMESKMENKFDSIEKSISSLKRRVRDIESDQRTTQAFGRVIQASGISFKDSPIPYPLQGNAAIEDIKDYY
jgi:hypothetical protein